MRVTIAAPAKVNLELRVGPRGEDGYHAISTLFCALDLADTLVLRPPLGEDDAPLAPLELAAAAPLQQVPDLGPLHANLAVRAAQAFLTKAGLADLPHIRLVKRVPPGAGLGGGSSDGAAVLRALLRLHPGRVDSDTLMRIAVELGSDVPFFALGAPLARGAGRGERLTEHTPLAPRPVVLVLPPFGVSTAAAYGWLDEDRSAGQAEPPSLDPAASEPAEPEGWKTVVERATNDFEAPVFRRHPVLREVRDALRERGAAPALLAGSGSTVFGVFPDRSAADGAAASLRDQFPDYRVLVTATRRR